MNSDTIDRLVLFGATGDLAGRYLVPDPLSNELRIGRDGPEKSVPRQDYHAGSAGPPQRIENRETESRSRERSHEDFSPTARGAGGGTSHPRAPQPDGAFPVNRPVAV